MHQISTSKNDIAKQMKDFVKYVGATIVGLFVFGIILTALGMMGLVGMVASAEATQKVKDNSVLVLDLNGVMEEQGDGNFKTMLVGTDAVGMRETLSAIKKAKDNKRVKGIFLNAGFLQADMAQLEELRAALADFKKTGKWIVAYGEVYSQQCYYLCSVANKIYMNPQGAIDWRGIGGQLAFVKDAYAKIGIKMIPVKCGKYKSATETYTEEHMSKPSREQAERYINGWWRTMCLAVSQSRGISVKTLGEYADRLISFDDPKNMVKYKLVDGLLYDDQVKDVVKKMLRIDKDDDINQISVDAMMNVSDKSEGDEIAVYYAYGEIIDDRVPQNIFKGQHCIVGKDVCRDLAALADDDNVKAVVLRVNTGGGSAYASEQIWHQVEQLKAKKPVVVSMSGAAASGGYYISCGANYIYAEPTTITGSIGIFGIIPDFSELMTQKIGIKYDEVKTNRNSTFGGFKPITGEQLGLLQTYLDRGYMLFKSRVAKGRHMSMDKVEANAQGHVFLGCDAIKLGLVDGLGGLDKAVAKAARLAKVKSYYTADYPAPASITEQFMDVAETKGDNLLNDKIRSALGIFYEPFMLMQTAEAQCELQARMPFFIKLK